jgi:hypothetical protein
LPRKERHHRLAQPHVARIGVETLMPVLLDLVGGQRQWRLQYLHAFLLRQHLVHDRMAGAGRGDENMPLCRERLAREFGGNTRVACCGENPPVAPRALSSRASASSKSGYVDLDEYAEPVEVELCRGGSVGLYMKTIFSVCRFSL